MVDPSLNKWNITWMLSRWDTGQGVLYAFPKMGWLEMVVFSQGA